MDFMNQNVVRRTMEFQLQKIMEGWAKVKLSKSFVIYGIRRYTRGAILLQHVDKIPSHIISVILQIDQKADEDWPLTLVDHKGIFMLIATHNLGRNGVFGGFQLLDLIITELKNSMPLIDGNLSKKILYKICSPV